MRTAAVLQPLKDRTEGILKQLEKRKTTGMAAMDEIAALAAERDTTMKSAHESGLSARAFDVFWSLRDDAAMKTAGIDPMEVYPDHMGAMQGLVRLQVRHQRTNDRTASMVAEIALRGENEQSRAWANRQTTKLPIE